MSKKVYVFTRYGDQGASSRVRFSACFPALRKQGLILQRQEFFEDSYLDHLYKTGSGVSSPLKIFSFYLRRLRALLKAPKGSTLWVEKELFPYVPTVLESYIFRRFFVILDLDDSWHLMYEKSLIGRLLAKNKISTLVKEADWNIVANPHLEEWTRARTDKPITLLPSCVKTGASHKSATKQEVVIGWIGTPVTEKYLELVRSPLEKLASSHKLVLAIMGGKNYKPIPGLEIRTQDWSLEGESSFLSSLDIGIMPLEDTEWEKGKSGYKLLQYMGFGKPVIGTPIGVNQSIIEHGVNGYHASLPEEWYVYLEKLIKDPSLRHRLGAQGRQKILASYAIEAYSKEMARILRQTKREKT